MRIVLDTNVFYVSISSRSPFHWIFSAFLEQKYTLCVTSDILNEYQEIIERYINPEVAEYTMKMLENQQNVEFITKYFQWHLVLNDYDDNKFVDCAVAANANYLVTNDKHFNILKDITFPSVAVRNIEQFKNIAIERKWTK